MASAFDKNAVERQLSRLPIWKQIAFAVLCCERMYPNYLLFERTSGWGDAQCLRAALDVAWSVLERGGHAGDLRSLLDRCEAAAPDTECFSSGYTSAALDAAVSTSLLIEILEKFNLGKVIEIGQLSFDTVYMYVDYFCEDSSKESDEVTLSHPLVKMELDRQRESIRVLAALSDDARVALPELRSRCTESSRAASLCTGSLP